MPVDTKGERQWRTREDSFAPVWESILEPMLKADKDGVLESKTMLAELAEATVGDEPVSRRGGGSIGLGGDLRSSVASCNAPLYKLAPHVLHTVMGTHRTSPRWLFHRHHHAIRPKLR